MRKLKLFITTLALIVGGLSANAQASYNHTYTEGVTVEAGDDFFLYNIGAGMFLTDGMDWGTHATADHAGRLITFAAAGEGKYSIYTASASVNNGAEAKAGFMTTNGYLDTGTNDANWEFTPVTVSEYTNAYTIKNSDTQYLYFDSSDARVNVGESTNDNYSYWIIVPKTTREAAKDYTFYLQNTDFNRPWQRVIWAGTAFTNQAGGLATNRCAEMYGKGFDLYQTINATVTNGKYKLYNQAFYNNADNANPTYLYANDDKAEIAILNANGEGTATNMDGASTSFTAGLYVNSVTTIVTNRSLKVGIKNATSAGNAWSIFDNFYLEYLGTCLVNDAVALPDGGDMAADTWYYFDVTAAADNYKATATTLAKIICTTDGTQLTAEATGNVTLTAENNSFTAQRYYVKSSSDNNLKIEVASYLYTVGTATADKAYIQKGNIVTVSYAGLATNDPTATLTKDFSGVTFDGESIEVTATDNGFSFTVPATVTAATAYTLAIPADAIGYASGNEMNAAQNITLTTPAVLDGVYYMYNTDTKTYISRAGNYNTQAVMDEWGLAFNVSTDASNNTKLQYFDSELWLGDDGFCYGDCTGTRVRSFNVTAVEGGYKFLNTNNSKYLAVNSGAAVADAEEGVNLVGTSNIWSLESTADHVANYSKNENAQAAAAATAAGLTGITTKAGLVSELTSNYGATPITITGSKAEKFQVYPGNGQNDGPVTYYSETVSDLKPGLYKLSVDALQRAAGNDRVFAADGARGVIYLYAGDAKTQLKSVSEYGSSTSYAGTDYTNNGLYYPNREGTAYDALATGNYANDVYVYVADAGEGTGSLEIGIKNPSRLGGDFSTWAVYNNWTLTRYEAKATTAEKDALAEAITDAEAKTLGFETGEYAPYNNVAALKAIVAAKALDPDAVSGAAVVSATAALNNVTWTANTGEVNAFAYGDFSSYETISGEDMPYGWNLYNGESNHSRIMGGTQGSDNTGLSASSTGKALLLKWDATYGETTGFTMPLKAGTAYMISFKYCGWGGNTPQTHVVMTDPSNNAITLNPVFKPAAGDGQADASHWYDFTGYFVSTTAGDYKFNLNKVESGQQQIAIADIDLRTAENITFADGSVPTYAPGTYPEVKISRNLREDYWASAIYPFAVSGVENIAVLNDYSVDGGGKGTLYFTDALASTPNVPFFMRSSNDLDEIVLHNVEVSAASATPAEAYYEAYKASLIGAYTTTDITADAEQNFVLKDNVIYEVGTDGATINPYRAYIQIGSASPVRTLTFSIDGEATAIEGIEAIQSDIQNVYNLNGQRIQTPKKGLYIKNGKKVIVK